MAKNKADNGSAPAQEEAIVETPTVQPVAELAKRTTEKGREIELKYGQCICHPPGKPGDELLTTIDNYNSLYKEQEWVLVAEKKS